MKKGRERKGLDEDELTVDGLDTESHDGGDLTGRWERAERQKDPASAGKSRACVPLPFSRFLPPSGALQISWSACAPFQRRGRWLKQNQVKSMEMNKWAIVEYGKMGPF